VDDGEFVALVGPSGCGKTTTLNLIAGLIPISGGDIFIGERKVNDLDPKDRDIAMVFQNYALYPNKSVYNNLAFPLQMRKLPKPEIDKKVKEAARVLDITHLLGRRPRELSGGQQQRVALGRALVRDPAAFLMDEPLSNLDAKLRVQMRTELKRFHTDLDATVIYVTHDQLEAVTRADKMAVMNGGFLQQYDSPDKVFGQPVNTFVAGFVGSPAMSLVPLEVIEEGEETKLKSPDGWSLALSAENARKARAAQSPKVILQNRRAHRRRHLRPRLPRHRGAHRFGRTARQGQPGREGLAGIRPEPPASVRRGNAAGPIARLNQSITACRRAPRRTRHRGRQPCKREPRHE
jgi:multiple sugar transport system ATP-binding protein